MNEKGEDGKTENIFRFFFRNLWKEEKVFAIIFCI